GKGVRVRFFNVNGPGTGHRRSDGQVTRGQEASQSREDALARCSSHGAGAKPRESRGQPTSECDGSALPSHSQRVDGGDELVEVERLAVASVAAEFVGDLR